MPDSTLKRGPECPKFRPRPNIQSWLTEKTKEVNIPGLSASITRPCGKNKPVDILRNEQNTFSIAFLPKLIVQETGIHKLNLLRSGEHVSGSPHEFTVSYHEKGGHTKCLAHGHGLQDIAVGDKAKFSILTSEAGDGRLAISVQGPSKPDIGYHDRKDGSSGVSYVVTEPGQYDVSVKFNEEEIPGSPFPVSATGVGTGPTFPRVELLRGKSDFTKVQTSGNGLTRGKVGKECCFILDCSKAGSNMLVIGIVGPTAPCEDISVRHNDRRCYEVKYTPMETGKFTIFLKWGEKDIRGSPFHVQIS